MSKVIIRKLAEVESPVCKSGDGDTFEYGKLNPGVSLPVDYEIEGELQEPIEVGRSIKVLRIRRNNVFALGQFETSEVMSWDGQTAKTLNSQYLVEEV